MDFKTVREHARDLLFRCESPAEAMLLHVVAFEPPWTAVTVLVVAALTIVGAIELVGMVL